MGIIEDLIKKGKLKHARLNDEMTQKKFEVRKKDYASAVASLEAANFKWAIIQVIMQYFMLPGHCYINKATVKKAILI